MLNQHASLLWRSTSKPRKKLCRKNGGDTIFLQVLPLEEANIICTCSYSAVKEIGVKPSDFPPNLAVPTVAECYRFLGGVCVLVFSMKERRKLDESRRK